MQAGKLRHRVAIQAPATAQDAYGEAIVTWGTVATVWASVEPLRGRELMDAQQTQSEISHRVRMRGRTGVTTQMRVLFEGRAFQVEAVLNPAERGIELQLMCREMPDDA